MKRIYAAKYLFDGDAPPVEGGALAIADGRIVDRGPVKKLQRSHSGFEVCDYDDALLLPLLVNAHTHLELTDYPDWRQQQQVTARPEDFVSWILQLIEVKKKVTDSAYRTSLANGIDQSLRSGTGAIGDILARHGLREYYQGCPLQGRLYLETLGQDPSMIGRLRRGLEKTLLEESCAGLELALSPHAPYTIRASYLRDLYSLCRQQGYRATTHLAESPAEVDFIQNGRGDIASRLYPFIGWEAFVPRGTGMRPLAYLDRQGGLFPGNLLVHGVQLEDNEISLLAERGMTLVLCPRSNARLQVGRSPAGKLLRAGVRLALGTDSRASCDSLSIWDELVFAHQWFNGDLDAPTLFRMATRGGAAALALKEPLTMQVGELASFQILRGCAAVSKAELSDFLVAPGRQQDIIQVIHAGQPLLAEQETPQ